MHCQHRGSVGRLIILITLEAIFGAIPLSNFPNKKFGDKLSQDSEIQEGLNTGTINSLNIAEEKAVNQKWAIAT